MTHTITPGTTADHPACADLWTAALAHRDGTAPDPQARARAHRALRHTPSLLLLLHAPGHSPGGYTLTHLPTGTDRTAHLAYLAIAPALQGGGRGRLLLDTTLEHLARTADAVTLQVAPANTAARALYESTGWQPLGPDRFDSGRPALRYRKTL
ncbi:GNAT family N-acetyltransferase [Nocardiopsis sp. NPDC006139]|uniref:GNAT family N-acetyltransferase n=1 Tax=Nocardiopsis TaxID=2013 RepID=UPI00339FFCB5